MDDMSTQLRMLYKSLGSRIPCWFQKVEKSFSTKNQSRLTRSNQHIRPFRSASRFMATCLDNVNRQADSLQTVSLADLREMHGNAPYTKVFGIS